ncbi:class III lanthipeptide [Paucisalibacillus globulus]|nr:class III lanthipeptide [Paucisalibacillus globulus]
MNKVLSLQTMESTKDIELRAGSSVSVNCKVISTISFFLC